jgi:molybdate transport system permease protein
MGEFGITLMIAGNLPGRTQTLPVAVYSAVASGNGQAARVLVVVVSAIAVAALLVANRVGGKRVPA